MIPTTKKTKANLRIKRLIGIGIKVAYLTSNIPFFRCLVRKEFTHNHEDYQGEYLHALAIAVNTIPDRCLSFNVVFTGCEAEDGEDNLHGGAMWARMPITGLVSDTPLEKIFR
jgi:hypothetical protein